MRIPKKIQVYGKTYCIVPMNSEENHGLICHEELKIFLDKSLEGDDKVQTLCHESIHAILHRIGVTQAISEGIEEIIADSIATWFVETFELKGKSFGSQRPRQSGDE